MASGVSATTGNIGPCKTCVYVSIGSHVRHWSRTIRTNISKTLFHSHLLLDFCPFQICDQKATLLVQTGFGVYCAGSGTHQAGLSIPVAKHLYRGLLKNTFSLVLSAKPVLLVSCVLHLHQNVFKSDLNEFFFHSFSKVHLPIRMKQPTPRLASPCFYLITTIFEWELSQGR